MRSLAVLAVAAQVGQAVASLNLANLTSYYFGNDAPWYWNRIPLFESSDQVLTDVYYYRWKVFRAHQRDLGANGYISIEFLNDVSWQTEPWASLNDATAFHILEGRWCRDYRFKNDYANFIFSSNSNTHQYSEHMADAVWQGYLVDGNANAATPLLSSMKTVYQGWNSLSYGAFNSSASLYWIQPLSDATEYTISSIDASGGYDGFTGGDSYRPSINAYQYANALAIASLSALTGDASTASTYQEYAAAIKKQVQNSLWNSTFQHFIDRYASDGSNVTTWNFIRGRELVGYVPWAHNLPDDNTTYAQAWNHILNSSLLAGPYGLRTVEPSYQYYMVQYRYAGTSPECQWNGPAWPFQTTQVLTGLSNLLDHYPNAASVITKTDYNNLLKQYARLHYNPRRGGELDIEEDYNSATGAPIVGLPRSPHYFHSGFVDLILSGYAGIRPSTNSTFEVNPLADPKTVTYFRADRILYHGHEVAVQWDATGSRYGNAGFHVEVDGAVAASSTTMQRLTVSLTANPNPAYSTPICKSVQLQQSSTYPSGSVSVPSADPARVHDAIDGRIQFFPETDVLNGYNTPSGNSSEQWYQIDFGTSTSTQSAEIALFSNSTQGYDVPATYSIQVNSGSWVNVTDSKYAIPVANGITYASWSTASTNQIRLVFTPQKGKTVRLVEFKVYSDLVTAPALP